MTGKASGSLMRVIEICLAIPGSLQSIFWSKCVNQTSEHSPVHSCLLSNVGARLEFHTPSAVWQETGS